MGIVRAFDPDTGASGGPAPAAASGADLAALGFISADLTDGWTLTDPDSLVNSTAHSSGVNTITMNALGAGSNDYVWSSGSTIEAPRWHKELKIPDINGTEQQVVTGNTYVLQVLLEFVAPSARFGAQIVIGTAADASSTTVTTMDLMGGIIQYPTSGNPTGGAIGQARAALGAANANYKRTYVTAGFTQGRMNTPTYINTNTSDAILASGQRATNITYADTTTNVDIMVGLGTANSSTTISASDDAKIKVWYRVVRLTLPS